MHYSFGPDQGLTLSDGLPDPGYYSIEVVFRFGEISAWGKIIDFKDLAVDEGLYKQNGRLDFYLSATGPSGAFAADIDAHLVVTRDDRSKEFIAYVDGVQQFPFLDTGENAVFTGPGNLIHFFKDDTGSVDTGMEASAGVVDRIVVYQGVLSQEQVEDVFAGVPPPVVPGVSALGLGLMAGLLLAASLWTYRRRRRRTAAPRQTAG